MQVQQRATKENTKSQYKDHTAELTFKGNSAFIETKHELEKKAGDSENKLTKPLVAFKWQKSCTKMKTDLQGSTAKAFSSFDQDDDEKSKNRLLFLKEALSDDEPNTAHNQNVTTTTCSYKEPVWSGIPGGVYKMDVLKAGVILKILNLSHKSYHVIGTSLSCDVTSSHETVSEFHAVLQYRSSSDSENETGIYIYDLNSAHGTFVNGIKIKPHTYVMVHGGDMVSFGNNQRKYILHTPKDSEEQEAQLSATELQELQERELQEQQKLHTELLSKESEMMRIEPEESKGISWGIIDVDELSRSTVDSEYSESDDEVSYLDNPKKALQDWFKWEGYDLEYQTIDEGFGRFSCCIDLTLDPLGSTKRIQCTVNGDKMKAVDVCTLKACKFLDDYGYLQQASKEKKSTVRNWEAVDYYDSDEDNYLDRTGAIERKRQKRMKMDGKTREMRDALSEKYAETCKRIIDLESSLNLSNHDKDEKENSENSNEDALDVFMTHLNKSSLSKAQMKNVKSELQNLNKERILLLDSITVSGTSDDGQSNQKTKNGYRFSK